jgi:hypothetical protein
MTNGFLVCKNVPIARTGVQDYKGSELGINEGSDQLFQVHRLESEVFSPDALASFEGVAFVDEHPSADVTVDNAQILSRGFVKDVRRGEGEDSDKVIADIIITDANTIAEIESGKREVSCGYACDYERDAEGRIFQRNIRGNHVALVGKGRAGKSVAIKDAGPKITTESKFERRVKFMKPKTGKAADKKGLLAKFFGMVTNDADPDVVAEIAEQLVEAVEEVKGEGDTESADTEPTVEIAKQKEVVVDPASGKKDEATNEEKMMAMLMELTREIGEIKSRVDGMGSSTDKKDSDPLEKLEQEIGGEENVTKPVEEMDMGDADKEKPAADTESSVIDPAGKGTGSSAAADAHAEIAKAKKVIAAIKDENTRRTVADAMAGLIRQTYGINPSTPKGSYGIIASAKKANAEKANDGMATFDNMEERQAAYDRRNPHLKKEGGK